jgi:hypothetical protein
MAHRNARRAEFGRLLLVRRVTELGWPAAQAAQALGVSRATADKWLARYRGQGPAGLADAAPDPTAAPTPCPPARSVGSWPPADATARARTGWPGGSPCPARPSMGCWSAIT